MVNFPPSYKVRNVHITIRFQIKYHYALVSRLALAKREGLVHSLGECRKSGSRESDSDAGSGAGSELLLETGSGWAERNSKRERKTHVICFTLNKKINTIYFKKLRFSQIIKKTILFLLIKASHLLIKKAGIYWFSV
jgi:hypothetical protein